MSHQEYPKVLRHPARQRARKTAEATPAIPPQEGRPMIPAQPEQWEPERYPDITVISVDDEQYYVAKGYQSPGMSDPAAFSTAKASPYVPGREVSEWPKMVGGKLMQDPNKPAGGPVEYPKWVRPPEGDAILVNSASEEDALMAQWTAPPETKKKGKETRV